MKDFISFNGDIIPIEIFEDNIHEYVIDWIDSTDYERVYDAIGASVISYSEAEFKHREDKADDEYMGYMNE